MGDVLVIAEAGVNHNGDVSRALEMVDVAAECGADVVKFQTFRADDLVVKGTAKAEYQRSAGEPDESMYELLKRLELDADAHERLLGRCRERGIAFLSTAFDLTSVELLRRLGQSTWKIPSGEITNLPYLERIGSFGHRLIVSTGMATLDEVAACVEVLVRAGTPRANLTLLHCCTSYPAPHEEANLRAMVTLKQEFGVRVGYSDHTLGVAAPVAAVALGAEVIEKHFTLDQRLPGPDHKAAIEPEGLAEMIRLVRIVVRTLGDGVKKPTKSEAVNILPVRKSIVAARSVRRGDVLTEDALTTKRPGTGVSPMRWHTVLGRLAQRDYARDDPIVWE